MNCATLTTGAQPNRAMMNSRIRQIAACVAAIGLCSATKTAGQEQPSASALTIVVVEGQGAALNIHSATARDVVVRVEDSNQKPVPGASVAFSLPAQGASGTFLNGQQSVVVTTGADGLAAAHGLRANNLVGKFEIRGTASLQGQTA